MLNIEKRVNKFENYWLTSQEFRLLFYHNICPNLEKMLILGDVDLWEKLKEKDLHFDSGEIFYFANGYLFPQRNMANFRPYTNEKRFKELGKKLGENGEIVELLKFAINDWDFFYTGLEMLPSLWPPKKDDFWDGAIGEKIINKNYFHLAGNDFIHPKIGLELKKIFKTHSGKRNA